MKPNTLFSHSDAQAMLTFLAERAMSHTSKLDLLRYRRLILDLRDSCLKCNLNGVANDCESWVDIINHKWNLEGANYL